MRMNAVVSSLDRQLSEVLLTLVCVRFSVVFFCWFFSPFSSQVARARRHAPLDKPVLRQSLAAMAKGLTHHCPLDSMG
jgi:hypothetical protein